MRESIRLIQRRGKGMICNHKYKILLCLQGLHFDRKGNRTVYDVQWCTICGAYRYLIREGKRRKPETEWVSPKREAKL